MYVVPNVAPLSLASIFDSPVFYIDATSRPSKEILRMFTTFFGGRGCRIALAIGTCAVVERGAEAFTVGVGPTDRFAFKSVDEGKLSTFAAVDVGLRSICCVVL